MAKRLRAGWIIDRTICSGKDISAMTGLRAGLFRIGSRFACLDGHMKTNKGKQEQKFQVFMSVLFISNFATKRCFMIFNMPQKKRDQRKIHKKLAP